MALSGLHIYWACGGKFASIVTLPERNGQPLFQPGAGPSVFVAALFLFAAWLVLQRSKIAPQVLPYWMVILGTWIVAAAFIARAIGEFNYLGFFKHVRETQFARLDSKLYSPAALLLGLGTAIVAWS